MQTASHSPSSPRALPVRRSVAPSLLREAPGSPIPGSIYYREYCTACGVAIRVPRNKVGKRCLCDHCRDSHARLD